MLLLLSSCAGPVPVSIVSTRDVHRPTDRPTPEIRELVDEAFDAWGVPWEPSNTIDASVELTLTGFDEDATVRGFNLRAGKCERSITVEPDALLLAHEIGHCFGIPDHDPEQGFVMSHPIVGWDLREAWIDTVQEDAERFSRCR